MQETLRILDQLYGLLAEETGRFTLACGDRCPTCCTVNVTATSLEAAYIFSRLSGEETEGMLRRLKAGFPEQCFRPRSTINGFAAACLQGIDLPEEDSDPAWGACPLLEDGRCTIYQARPLGCRVMVSQLPCGDRGEADMPPLAMTFANILAQTVEQLDQDGVSGNFLDVLGAYGAGWQTQGNLGTYLPFNAVEDPHFLGNQPVPALMVPPEHRNSAASFIGKVRTAVSCGKSAGD